MPNVYFRAKYLWEHGDRERAFTLFDHAIGEQIGAEPFVRPDYLMTGSITGDFESLVVNLLTETFVNSARTFLQVPFGRVWAALWTLDRFDQWVNMLLRYDFFCAPEAIGFDEEEFAPPANEARDFDAIIEVLAASAHKGELSGSPHERPNGGRAVLTLDMIDAVDDVRWGALKPRLHARLTDAYSASPADPWKRRVADDAEGVLIDFLHDLFGRYGTPNASAQARWEVIRRDHPAYADAAQSAAVSVLGRTTAAYAIEIVRFDAGRDVADGAVWLHELVKALNTGIFSTLD